MTKAEMFSTYVLPVLAAAPHWLVFWAPSSRRFTAVG